MKLCNVIIVYDYAFVNGGAAKVAIDSAIELAKAVNVIYFAGVGPVCNSLAFSRATVVCLNQNDINTGSKLHGMSSGLWNERSYHEFKKLLSKCDPNTTIVHFHGWVKCLSVSVIRAAQMLNFKCLITLHDYFTICPNGGIYNYKKGEICQCSPSSVHCYLRNCDKRNYIQKIWRDARQILQNRFVLRNNNISYIYISELNRRIVQPYVKSDSFYRVINPVDVSNKKVLRKQHSNTCLFVGRLSDQKAVDVFCEAVHQLHSANIDITGMVVGEGDLLCSLRQQYPDIIFTGWKEPADIDGIMKSARLLVFPSRWYQGAPLTIIEALSRNLPCIVSDCTSAIEIVSHGINGLVYHVDDINELKCMILRSFDESIYAKLLKGIDDSFDANCYRREVHAKRLIDVYIDCLNNREHT